jgi:Cu+-exporting ATPase
LFLRDATVIEQIAKAGHIVFDKTGTITTPDKVEINCMGYELNRGEKNLLYSVVSQSNHPNSIALTHWLGMHPATQLDTWKEIPGSGIAASKGKNIILVGSGTFIGMPKESNDLATFYVKINDNITSFDVLPVFRKAMPEIINDLKKKYSLSLLSGDNNRQQNSIGKIFGAASKLLFGQKPIDKLKYIEQLQQQGSGVIMIGDGLNDAGALQQSNVGITITENVNNFTPACDAIFSADKIAMLPALFQLAKQSDTIIKMSFVISILYNIVGLYFAMTGQMRPVVAAILMPCSTLSIVIISSSFSNLMAWRKGLRVRSATED